METECADSYIHKDEFGEYMVKDFETFITFCSDKPNHYRIGQWGYTLLEEIRPSLAKEVRQAENLDPYYNDGNYYAFMRYVERNW